jgi:hypothetical protein
MSVSFVGPLVPVPTQARLPAVIRLDCVQDSDGAGDTAHLTFQLDADSNVWFADDMPAPGRSPKLFKSFTDTIGVHPAGTDVPTNVILVFGSGRSYLTAPIYAQAESATHPQAPSLENCTIRLL